MSGDEVFALLGSIFAGLWGWSGWTYGLFRFRRLIWHAGMSAVGWMLPVLASGFLFFVLHEWSSHDVRDDPSYQLYYLVMWFGWTGVWNFVMAWFDLDFGDAVSYGNRAQLIAIAGGFLSVTFIFAGGNIGEGPSWVVVVFCAGVGTATLLLFWLAQNQFSDVHDAIVIDRDQATGWRSAGFFVGSGLILGRAVAGDWHSIADTLTDFAVSGWPVLLPAALLLFLNVRFRSTPAQPSPDPVLFGVLPAVLLVAIGIGDLLLLGPWQ